LSAYNIYSIKTIVSKLAVIINVHINYSPAKFDRKIIISSWLTRVSKVLWLFHVEIVQIFVCP